MDQAQRAANWKIRAVFLAACGGALVVFSLFIFGFYPVAIVDGSVITARKFRAASHSVLFYYENTGGISDQEENNMDSARRLELESQVLNDLVEEELIAKKLARDFGSELPYLIAEELDGVKNSPDLKQAATMLYGMKWENFEKEILVSEAKKSILANQLFLKNEKIEDWIHRARESANVTVFSLKFKWDDSKVIVKNQ